MAKEELIEKAEPWRPYRSIGTWFIWRSFGNVPPTPDMLDPKDGD